MLGFVFICQAPLLLLLLMWDDLHALGSAELPKLA